MTGTGTGTGNASARRDLLAWGAVGALLAGVLLNGYVLVTGRSIGLVALLAAMAVAGVGTTAVVALAGRLLAATRGTERD